MTIVTTGLIADGTSDRALIPLLKLLLKEHLLLPFEEPQLIKGEQNDLASKVRYALDKFSLDILFIHRDTENESWEDREAEIRRAVPPDTPEAVVFVIPMKMTEAWLLTDAAAIRQAVGNPNSKVDLGLPTIKKIESCSAKEVLFNALINAKEHGAQRRRTFKPDQYRHRVAELTSNLQSLRQIKSFKRLEDNLIPCLTKLNNAHTL
jgi:hypothetical protein